MQRCAGANQKAERVEQRNDDRRHESRLSKNAGNLNRHNVYHVFDRHTPDGKWIAAGGIDAKGPGLFKIPTDGGAPVRLIAGDSLLDPVWSPDGNLIVYVGPTVALGPPLLAVRPDGAPVQLPDIRFRAFGQRYQFLPDGNLVYMQGDTPSQDFWLLDLASKARRPLTHLMNKGAMLAFDVTPDGKQIVFDRLRVNGDLVLIDRKP